MTNQPLASLMLTPNLALGQVSYSHVPVSCCINTFGYALSLCGARLGRMWLKQNTFLPAERI
jgi:hypothetical protein